MKTIAQYLGIIGIKTLFDHTKSHLPTPSTTTSKAATALAA